MLWTWNLACSNWGLTLLLNNVDGLGVDFDGIMFDGEFWHKGPTHSIIWEFCVWSLTLDTGCFCCGFGTLLLADDAIGDLLDWVFGIELFTDFFVRILTEVVWHTESKHIDWWVANETCGTGLLTDGLKWLNVGGVIHIGPKHCDVFVESSFSCDENKFWYFLNNCGIDGIEGKDGGNGIGRIDGIDGMDGIEGNLWILWAFLSGDIDWSSDGDVDGISGIILNGIPDISVAVFDNFPETVTDSVDTSVV